MKHPILNILKDIEKELINSEISTEPFPHITFNINIDNDVKTNFINISKQKKIHKSNGRLEYILSNDMNGNADIDNVINTIGQLIRKKLNLEMPIPTSQLNGILSVTNVVVWFDDNELDILDIHLDYIKPEIRFDNITINNINENTQSTVSMHLYLPDDTNHSELGTRLYAVPDNVEKTMADAPVLIPSMIKKSDEHKCSLIKTIPYLPGNVFIHSTSTDTWHQAPKVPKGYIRKSMMIRWTYNLIHIG
jgi:hypothetical protein